jgi:predicted outer membrane repeat protein
MLAVRWVKAGTVLLGFLLLASLLTPARPARATTVIYVTPTGSAAADCGSTWVNACSLQTALTKAVAGDQIWVAEGVYVPGGPGEVDATFLLSDAVALYGGFAGSEAELGERDWSAHPTILSGDLAGDDINLDGNHIAETWEDIRGTNAYHVLTFDASVTPITPDTMVDGVIITAGDARDSLAARVGGGVYCSPALAAEPCSPTLTDVLISGNHAFDGGGMYMRNGAHHPVLTRVTFQGNRADHRGGGLYVENGGHPMLTDVAFLGNHADSGGGFYSGSNRTGGGITLDHVELIDNYAERDGGGAYLFADRANQIATFTDVLFQDNGANKGGGLLDNTGRSETQFVRLVGVTFDGNHAYFNGGGMARITELGTPVTNAAQPPGPPFPLLVDVTFVRNRADMFGGGLFIGDLDAPSAELYNVTFAGNQAMNGGGLACTHGCVISLYNALFSGNHAGADGGGLYTRGVEGGTSSATVVNATFSGNHAAGQGGAVAITAYLGGSSDVGLANSILWGNTATPDPSIALQGDSDPYPLLGYSLVEGWPNDPGNHVWGDRDPLFIAPTTAPAPTTRGNYRLRIASPAIDAGNNDRVPAEITTDLDGTLRFVDVPGVPNTGKGTPPIVDMGAYEHPGTADPSPEPTDTPSPTASPTGHPSPEPSLTPTVALTPTPKGTPIMTPTPESGEGGVQRLRIYLPLVIRLP